MCQCGNIRKWVGIYDTMINGIIQDCLSNYLCNITEWNIYVEPGSQWMIYVVLRSEWTVKLKSFPTQAIVQDGTIFQKKFV